MMNPKSLVILGIKSFEGNPYDSNTIRPLLEQLQSNFGYQPQEVIYDRGGKGKAVINGVKISIPKPAKNSDSQYQKRKIKKSSEGGLQ